MTPEDGRAAQTAPIAPNLTLKRRPAEPPGQDQAPAAFGVFLQLERLARRAQTPAALHYVMVNETRRLIDYRQAVLARRRGARYRVEAVSGVGVLDRSAPFLLWLERAMPHVAAKTEADVPQSFDASALPPSLRGDWAEWSAQHLLWCPLTAPDGRPVGGLWLTRATPWQEAETRLLKPLAETYAHAWAGLVGRRRLTRGRRLPRWPLVLAALGGIAAALVLIPVPQSALAPAEVVGHDPHVVAAPLDGVIARFAILPNQPVATGDELFRFEDTTLRSQRDVAERTLDVARAELQRARQGAFADRDSAAQVALLEARVRQRETELAFAQARLERSIVTAPRSGVAVFGDPRDWIGRPVQTGERVLEVADPADVELQVHLPVGEALALPEAARVQLFLDADPLTPVVASLERAAYRAEPGPDGSLAYRLTARFPADLPPPRIGLRGTAKISGQEVPLGYYLFRRPLSALRQSFGF